jgi:hypothetical protein
MGAFAVLLAMGFIVSILWLGAAVESEGWRAAWAGMGWLLVLGLAPAGLLLARSTPESCGLEVDPGPPAAAVPPPRGPDLTAAQALRTPAFWAFTLGSSLFNLAWSAITLFNQSILEEQGFGYAVDVGGSEVSVFVLVMAVLTAAGLVSNLIGGWLATRRPMGALLGVGLVLLAAALAAYPALTELCHLLLYAAALGVAGGLITVVHFAVYAHAFGRAHLGQVQGAAQVVTVFASALGPVLLIFGRQETGSYAPLFYAAAGAAVVLGLCAWLVRLPRAAGEPGRNA